MHTDAAQTVTLHALPAFAAWARARGIRPWDVVECGWYEPAGPLLVLYTDEEGDCWLYDNEGRCVGHGRPADCRLMPSESDLFAYLRSRGFGTISLVLLNGGEEGVELWKHGERWGYAATTRIGALVAACKAEEE